MPLPELVGPDTSTVPPLMYTLPLESMPSPEAFTYSVPPLMRSSWLPAANWSRPHAPLMPEESTPPAAFTPSSVDTTDIWPPFMAICAPSSPS